MRLSKFLLVDAVNYRQIGICCRGRDEHFLGACFQVCGGFFLGCKEAGAFQRNVDAEFFPGKFRRVAFCRDFDRTTADIHARLGGFDFAGEGAMHAVIFQHVGVGFHASQIVDGNDFDVLAARFRNGPKDETANAAKTINRYTNCHILNLLQESLDDDWDMLGSQSRSFAAATAASAVMLKCL